MAIRLSAAKFQMAWRNGAVLGCALLLAGTPCAEEVVRATGHPNWPPFSWQSGDKIVGIGAELAEIVFRDLGFKVVAAPSGNWKRAQADAQYGHVDIIVAIYQTEERKTFLAYPAPPYMEDANVVWVARGRSFRFDSWDDLVGKRGSAMLGESYGEKFDRFIKDRLHIEWVNTPEQSLRKLDMGRVDYYPFSLYGGKIQVRQLGMEDRIEHLAQLISTEGTYIGIARRSRLIKYLPQIEAAIARRRADGTVERLTQKYVALAAQIEK